MQERYSNSNLKPFREKPPFPVSTATKNKLSNFQYSAQSNSELKTKFGLHSDDQKDDEDTDTDKTPNLGEDDLQHELKRDILPDLSNDTTPKNPSTPASKLALPDLIAMGDVRPIKQITSPEDRIEWDHNKGKCHESIPNFGAVRTTKRKARSSSPTESSPVSTSVQFDPGSELWGRYSFGGSKISTSQGPSVSSLSYIMHTLSPKPTQTGITPRSVAELRRANSCGSHFPKRKKYNDTNNDDVFTGPAIIGPSKLSVLIERVQEGLIKPMQLNSLQWKSPDTKNQSEAYDTLESNEDLPTLFKTVEENVGPNVSKKQPLSTPLLQDLVIPNDKPESFGSSDYGDFDDDELDTSLLDVVNTRPEMPILQQPSELISVNSPRTLSNGRRSSSASTMTIKASEHDDCHPESNDQNDCHPESNDHDSDIFDDSEDDILNEDLEVLISQYDMVPIKEIKNLPSNALTESSQNPNFCAGTKDEFDDEYPDDDKFDDEFLDDDEFDDGDLDDDDFKAAEASTLEISNSHLAVRTKP